MRYFRTAFAVALVAVAASSTTWISARQVPYDLIVRNGHIVDGTGNPWFAADVGIRGDRIVAVGSLAGRAPPGRSRHAD